MHHLGYNLALAILYSLVQLLSHAISLLAMQSTILRGSGMCLPVSGVGFHVWNIHTIIKHSKSPSTLRLMALLPVTPRPHTSTLHPSSFRDVFYGTYETIKNTSGMFHISTPPYFLRLWEKMYVSMEKRSRPQTRADHVFTS